MGEFSQAPLCCRSSGLLHGLPGKAGSGGRGGEAEKSMALCTLMLSCSPPLGLEMWIQFFLCKEQLCQYCTALLSPCRPTAVGMMAFDNGIWHFVCKSICISKQEGSRLGVGHHPSFFIFFSLYPLLCHPVGKSFQWSKFDIVFSKEPMGLCKQLSKTSFGFHLMALERSDWWNVSWLPLKRGFEMCDLGWVQNLWSCHCSCSCSSAGGIHTALSLQISDSRGPGLKFIYLSFHVCFLKRLQHILQI